MSVKKIGKVWSFRINAGLDSRTGKRKQIYRGGFNTKREALDEMNKLTAAIMNGEYSEPSKTLFKDYIHIWLHTYKYEVQMASFELGETIVRVHLIPYFQSTPLEKITSYDIDQLYAQKLDNGLANATVKRIHNLLSKALQKAVKWGLLKNNPAKDASPPSIHKKRKQIWTVEEVKAFLKVCEQENALVPFLLAIFTGMRRGEILALKWKYIDLIKGVIHVEESLTRTKRNGLLVKVVKTSHSERDVYLSASIRDSLIQYRQQQGTNHLGLVIQSKNGTYLEPRNLLRKFQALTKKANVPKIPFHNLRHTHATILMRMGENPKVVSERLGHARVGITLDIYSHTNEEMQKNTADRFDDRFWT
ncbi:site-specific integrase [Bacillus sp. F19]|nr:site-specific integrase [Bacillus sp. F19]